MDAIGSLFVATATLPQTVGGEPFRDLAERGGVALLIGLLVGAEREFSHSEKEILFAGVRTFPLIAMLGFLAALISQDRSPLIFAAVAVAFGAFVIATYVLTSLGEDKGATTEIAGLTVFFLGALCYWNYAGFASAVAVVAALLLSMRKTLHEMVAKLERDDVYAALKLAIVTLIVLPLLPDEAYGPYDALNPHKTWKYVVLIASISFAGYVAVKVLGAKKGIGVTGIFGGLASSTAVALAFSRKSKEEPRLSRAFAAAIVLASSIMPPRVLAVAVLACPPLLPLLWLPVGLMTLAGLASSGLLILTRKRSSADGEGISLKNPFELASAVKFGLLLAVISFVARAAYALFRERGLYVVSIVLGLADADGFAVQAAGAGMDAVKAAGAGATEVAFLATAARAIVFAMISNTVVKGWMTAGLGARELRKYTVPAFAAIAVAGVASAFLLL